MLVLPMQAVFRKKCNYLNQLWYIHECYLIGIFLPFFKKKKEFTTCKAEQLLQSMELQEKGAQKG